jgi:lysine N6-hydroxylase
VLGTGTKPHIPEKFHSSLGNNVFHSSEYKKRREQLEKEKSLTVIGSGQSAAEIFYDLLVRQPEHDYRLSWFTRSKGFYPMEYSKLGLEHFSPDYTHYFYQLPSSKKEKVLSNQSLLYKGISADTIAAIYDLLYERTSGGKEPNVRLQALTELVSIETETDSDYHLTLYQHEQERTQQIRSGGVILATGYAPYVPDCLKGMEALLQWDESGQLVIEENYQIKLETASEHCLFIQNGELHTHGVGAPDLGLGAFRNAVIINQIVGKEVYSVESNNVYQQFGF